MKDRGVISTKITENVYMVQLEANQVPMFSIDRNKKLIKYGDKNDFPDHLIYLYQNSPVHQAIVNTKANYLSGNNLKADTPKAEQWLLKANPFESWYEVTKKEMVDKPIFGAYAIMIKTNAVGQPIQFFHVDFGKLRLSEDFETVLYSDDWSERTPKINAYPFYKSGQIGTSILVRKDYLPSISRLKGAYPLPEYMASMMDIETDIEISNWCNSYIKNGFSATSMITIFGGEVKPEEKRNLAERLKQSHTGSGNAGKFVLAFADKDGKGAEISSLQANDVYQQFQEITKRNQQNIISGHQFHPILAGIKTEGQLGGRSEFMQAHDQFLKGYVKPEQARYLKDLEMLYFDATGEKATFEFEQVESLGYDLLDPNVSKFLTQDEVRKELGFEPIVKEEAASGGINDKLNVMSPLVATKVLEFMTEDEVRSLAGLKQKGVITNPDGSTTTIEQGQANESISNLSRRQTTNLLKVVQDYNNGRTTKEQAMILLKGYGLTDSEAKDFLGIAEEDGVPIKQARQQDKFFNMIDRYIVDLEEESILLEETPVCKDIKLAYSGTSNELRTGVLNQIKGNPFIKPEELAKMFKADLKEVQATIKWLSDKSLIEIDNDTKSFTGTKKAFNTETENVETEVYTVYYYDKAPDVSGNTIIPTTRDFCRTMYSKANKNNGKRVTFDWITDQENEFGDNAWDFRGGFYNDGEKIRNTCRHVWMAETRLRRKR